MFQSVLRYMLLPLMIVGVFLAFRLDRRLMALMMATVFYYLVVGSLLHTHIRYGLPMYALLTIFGGVTLSSGLKRLRSRANSRKDLPG